MDWWTSTIHKEIRILTLYPCMNIGIFCQQLYLPPEKIRYWSRHYHDGSFWSATNCRSYGTRLLQSGSDRKVPVKRQGSGIRTSRNLTESLRNHLKKSSWASYKYLLIAVVPDSGRLPGSTMADGISKALRWCRVEDRNSIDRVLRINTTRLKLSFL